MRTIRFSLPILLLFAVLPAFSATYIVPEDRELVVAARAIVTGSVIGTHVRRRCHLECGGNASAFLTRESESGGAASALQIETETEIAVEEWIKGSGAGTISIALPGGQLGDERLTVPGVPSFAAGDRVLLFLTRNGRGDWTTLSFALGAFVADDRGVLAREEIFGWTTDGMRHREPARLERPFVDYVRAIARGESAKASYFAPPEITSSMLRVQPNATYSAGSYSYSVSQLPLRRSGAVAEWRISGQAGDLDITKSGDLAVAAWASVTATFRDTRGAPATGDVDGDDGEWRIIMNDPHDEIPDECCFGIVGGAFLIDSGVHVYNNETFRTLTHADLLFNDGISSATLTQEQLDDIVTHEIGHSLGLRHADRNSANDAACPAGANCCLYTNDGGNCRSVMNSLENAKVTGLHKWDRDAIACLYEGNCTSACVAPSFLEAPRRDMIFVTDLAILQTRVFGTPPLTVQWYAGERGDTSKLVETNRWSFGVTPAETTKYWVRVTDACGQIDSDAAEITVLRCPPVKITRATATIVSPGKVRLRVTAGGEDRYRWYRSQGPGLPSTQVGLFDDITISFSPGQTFWVRVANGCGNNAVSELLTPTPEAPPTRRRRTRH